MAKGRAVPGLTFRMTIEPFLHGAPFTDVPSKVLEWDQSLVADSWHEGHTNLRVHGALRDMKKRVADILKVRQRGKR